MAGSQAAERPRRDVLDRLGVPVPDPAVDPVVATAVAARRLVAIVRWGLVPVLVVGGLVADDLEPVFWALLAARLVASVAGQALPRTPPAPLGAAADLVLLTGMLLASGGGTSPLRIVLLALPVVAGCVAVPWAVAAMGAGTGLAALVSALPQLADAAPGAADRLASLLAGIAFSTLVGVCFAAGREALTRRAAATDAARRRLLTAALSAEDQERRRVSHELHGEALQVLLAAAQDLEEDDPEGVQRAREGVRAGVAVLRDTVRDLHPAALRHAGLEASLRAALARRVHGAAAVHVEPGADGAREALLLSLVRELGDALAQVGIGDGIAARVALASEAVVLVVGGDGHPGDGPALRLALAGCAERVEADGGTLDAHVGYDGRATIEIRLPRAGAGAPVPAEPADDATLARRSQLLFSALCLAWVPVTVVVAVLGGDPGWGFAAVALATAAYHAGAVWWARSARWRLLPAWPCAAAATVAFAAAVATQGGITTELPALALVFPFLLIVSFGPGGALAAGGLLGLALAAIAAPEVLRGDPGARDAAAVLAAAYAWAVASGLLLGAGRQRMRRRLAALEHARRQLLHQGLAAADEERRRLSERLHDGALQELLIAGQDLDEALDGGDPEALLDARVVLATGLAQLRDLVADLHPPALEHGGLRPAVVAVLERAQRRGAFAPGVEVDPAADGVRDELVLALVRELVANAGKHAQAAEIRVRVARDGDRLELEVRDDGVGITPERLAAAVAEGHIGLAAARERVEAEGGTLDVAAAPGGGTAIRVSMPVAPAAGPGLRPAPPYAGAK